jgi:hypothetical protein
MDTLARARDASIQVGRIQRRIWLIQTVFWPLVGITGLVLAFVAVRSVWRRRETPTHVVPAAPQEPVGLNGASSGN